jgi:DNA modification methylase
MKIQSIAVTKINPAPYNPRKDLKPGDPEYEKLLRSIEEFGCVEPLVWNSRSKNLVGGHQRFNVLLARGQTKVDVSVVDLSPEREKALNIALNKISGDWDPRKLAELLDELVHVPDFDIALTGFDVPDVKALIAEMLPSQEDQEEHFDVAAALDRSKPPVTQKGELIKLGYHRLFCGDCTDPATVKFLMNGERAVLFATDPPYLVDYDGTNHPSRKHDRAKKDKNKDWSATYGVTWDEASGNSDLYDNFIRVAIAEAILPGAAWYCWHASRRQTMVEAVWIKHGAFVHQQIIWFKDRPILTHSWYTWQHEPCFFGWIKTQKPPRRSKDFPSTIWQIPTIPVGQATEHPTSKPLEVFMIPMRQHTRPGELCYEPFCGSGSQLIAAQKLNRRCYALEIDQHYCDVIVRRYLAFTAELPQPDAAQRRELNKLRQRYQRSGSNQQTRAA